VKQERAVPVMPRENWRRERRMEGLIVSKAALRSRRMRMVKKPESASMAEITAFTKTADPSHYLSAGI